MFQREEGVAYEFLWKGESANDSAQDAEDNRVIADLVEAAKEAPHG